jgi:hypothetical protein
MKVGELLAQVNKIKPNAFDDNTLLTWLNRIEAMIQTEIMKIESEKVKQYTLPESIEKELILTPPHDQCYELYISAQIDIAQQEYASYQNTMVLFNNAFNEMKKYYIQKKKKNLKINAKL